MLRVWAGTTPIPRIVGYSCQKIETMLNISHRRNLFQEAYHKDDQRSKEQNRKQGANPEISKTQYCYPSNV